MKCQTNHPLPPKAPLHPWEYPSRPWTCLHIDHAGPFLGHTFLIVVDAHSKWIESHIVNSTSSEATIKVLRNLFATHGIPEHVVSDNGSAFTSQEFKQFMEQNGIKHTTTSPYPSSNGLAERAVQTVKHGISKLEGTIECGLARFLFNYRVTPQSTTELSPAELLMGRRLRTRLDLIHPDTSQKVIRKQGNVENSSTPRHFKVGDKLYAKDFSGKGKWFPASVIKVTGPISYKLKTQSGHFIRRHLDHLRVRYLPDNTVTDPRTDHDDWSVSSTYTSPTTEGPLNVSPSTHLILKNSHNRLFVGQPEFVTPVDRYTPVST